MTCILIPARIASSRFPRKLLSPVGGATALAHTYANAVASSSGDVHVVTSDREIADACSGQGMPFVWAGESARNGTERVAMACDCLGIPDDMVVANLQGDECCIPPQSIVWCFVRAITNRVMATAACPTADEEESMSPSAVKLAAYWRPDHDFRWGTVAHFTRASMTHDAVSTAEWLRHVGIYVAPARIFREYLATEPTHAEQIHRLEQLRWTATGHEIVAVRHDSWFPPGLDEQSDAPKIARWVANVRPGSH